MKPNIERIKKELKQRNWSGSKLASKMGISRMEMSRILRGQHSGGKKCIGGLIKAFPEIPIDELFFFD